MIKLEKRLYPFCEECKVFSPCSIKTREKLDDNSYAIKVLIRCSHSDLCINAVNQYNKLTEMNVKKENLND